ncbi:high-affinity nickel-transporter [Exophiala viscosa]|uniref:High-affinity nickel-transporter n=1 Tax=Exophiala viscosa TaxID=2486360 RepID=A0AAN6I9T5_9EURO|nr:high-affinity nickel-transporter [Exophiala viscosa]KAI1625003.1 high-affinity nickel-transporter [Exophiala viscosa]
METTSPPTMEAPQQQFRKPWKKFIHRTRTRLSTVHSGTPYLRRLPLAAILIIALLIIINLVAWAICALVLTAHTRLLSTAALAYTLGLRHALDADHISAIDLMTRRLIATGQRPVTVGTFFSLGHSTIVVVTSIVVAATAAGVSKRFNGFSNIGGIIGSSVSAAFLILLGLMNAYILYRLVLQIRKVIRLRPHEEAAEAWKIEGAGCLFRVLKSAFRLIDRPWKMYPLGVLFGLGFDTSSEIALLGISSIQGAKGTSMWLILVFPVLFTAGMCLVDTIDGALMMSLYVAPMGMSGPDDKKPHSESQGQRDESMEADVDLPADTDRITPDVDGVVDVEQHTPARPDAEQPAPRVKDPLTFLYYSIVLTTLTVICAIIIGVIQLLTMILNVATPTGKFWDGVETAGDNYEIIGGSICASFVVFGGISVLCYKPWRQWVDRERQRLWAGGSEDAGDAMPGSSYRDEEARANIRENLVLSEHGDAEELIEVPGKTGKTAQVSVKAYDGTDGIGVPGGSGSRQAGRKKKK